MYKPTSVLALSLLSISTSTGSTAQEAVIAPVVEAKSATHEALVRAIREKQVLRFTYNGHVRVVEPHAYGVSAAGETVLHAF